MQKSVDNKINKNMNLDFTLVIPVFNEEECLSDMYKEVKQVMQKMDKVFEVVFVNDCSNDRSAEILKSFQEQDGSQVQIITLNKRSGQTFAMRTGLNAARGSYVVTLDADLQNDPADIPKMLEKLSQGYDCVCGWRKAREDTPLKAGLSKFGNVMQRLISGLKIHDVSCTLRIYRKENVDKITLNWEGQHRFIPLSLSLQGFKIGEIVSNHRKRRYGITKYSHKRVFRVVVDFFKILAAKGRK